MNNKNDEHKITDKSTKRSTTSYLISACFGLFSIFLIYLIFSDGFSLENFQNFFILAIISGIIAFMFGSPWIRLNYLIGGLITLIFGFYMLVNILSLNYNDFWLSLIWTIAFLLLGLSFILRFFNTTIFKSLHKISQTKTVRGAIKIIFWSAIVAIIFLIFGGLLSFIAGLSATTIIIILLILILFK